MKSTKRYTHTYVSKVLLGVFFALVLIPYPCVSTPVGRNEYNVIQNSKSVRGTTKVTASPVESVPMAITEPDIKIKQANIEPDNLIQGVSALNAAIRELENEIMQMDSELRRCDRARADWRSATIIGSIGVGGTTIGAVIQSAQISKAKKEAVDQDKLKDNESKK